MIAPPWESIRPRFQRMVFSEGCRVVADRTELGLGTVYDLVNEVTEAPHRRTVRDVAAALEKWESEDGA